MYHIIARLSSQSSPGVSSLVTGTYEGQTKGIGNFEFQALPFIFATSSGSLFHAGQRAVSLGHLILSAPQNKHYLLYKGEGVKI
jgi:hypothetical protein